MYFRIEIESYNDGSDAGAAYALHALERVVDRLKRAAEGGGIDALIADGRVLDVNGNTVGDWELAQHPPKVASLIADAAAGDPGEGDE